MTPTNPNPIAETLAQCLDSLERSEVPADVVSRTESDPQPIGQSTSKTYGVPYDRVMALFLQGL